jgi:hypothetical protein
MMTTAAQEKELETFKKDINLAAFALTLGYEIDKKESSRASLILRKEGDKVIVGTSKENHFVYFSVRDNADNGTIIDFIQKRTGKNLREVRKHLRDFQEALKPSFSYHPKPTTRERHEIAREVLAMRSAENHPYLLARGLTTHTLKDPRFINQIRTDEKGNVIFPHRDRDGITGYEVKNKGFTGFSPGGSKALWYSDNIMPAQEIIITESALDALSHAQLDNDKSLAYVSICGSLSGIQKDLLKSLIEKAMDRGTWVKVGTDNDEAGNKYFSDICDLAPESTYIKRERPNHKDWNDDLNLAFRL